MAFIGCGLTQLPYDSGGGLGTNVDRGNSGDIQVYPDDDQDVILVYTGHGGTALRPFSNVRSAWESDGWTVRESDVFPEDLRPFRLIVLVDTGANRTEDAGNFTDEEMQALSRSLQRGSRIVLLKEPNSEGICHSDAFDQLIDQWGVPFRYESVLSSDGVGTTQTFDSFASSEQLTEQVGRLSFRGPCALSTGGTWLVRGADSTPLVSRHEGSAGGDVVLIGDVDLLKNTVASPDNNDNVVFAQNLARIVP